MAGTELRHYCRNRQCRTKLPTPTDNPHKAFCARLCHATFYRSRCVVCEKPIPGRRATCSARECRLNYRRFRETYTWPERKTANTPQGVKSTPETPDFIGSKSPLGGGRRIRITDAQGTRLDVVRPATSLWAATLKLDAETERRTRAANDPANIAKATAGIASAPGIIEEREETATSPGDVRGSKGPRNVIAAEIIEPHEWEEYVSSDGVVSFMTMLRKEVA